MLYLEHVNINSGPWNANLETFYFAALGFQRDPRTADTFEKFRVCNGSTTGLTWANIGLQQFHLPWDDIQVLRGVIGLVYPSLEILAPRLRANGVGFEVNQFYSKDSNGSDELISETIFDLVCPVGNRIRIHEYTGTASYSQSVPVWFGPDVDIPIVRTADDINNVSISDDLSMPGTTDYYGLSSNCKLPGGLSIGLGISYVDFNVPGNTAYSICEFYSHFFGVQTSVEQLICRESKLCVPVNRSSEFPDLHHHADADDIRLRCTVLVGISQHLHFTEISTSNNQIPSYDGHHIAIYVSNFDMIYNRFVIGYNANSSLLWNNPRFMRTATYSLQDAIKHSEFRVKDIVDINTGEVLYELEHEIRFVKLKYCWLVCYHVCWLVCYHACYHVCYCWLVCFVDFIEIVADFVFSIICLMMFFTFDRSVNHSNFCCRQCVPVH